MKKNLLNKNIACIVERKNSLEFFLPFIQRFLKKYTDNNFIFLKIDNSNQKKNYLNFDKNSKNLIGKYSKTFFYETNEDLNQLCEQLSINYVCSFRSNKYLKILQKNLKFILLQMNFDTFVINNKNDFINSDMIVIYSQFWKNFYKRIFGLDFFNKTKNKLILFQSPKYLVELQNKKILFQKYNLNPKKKYLLVLPMNLNSTKSVWSYLFQINIKILQIIIFYFFKIFNFKITNYSKKLIQFSLNEKKLATSIYEFAKLNNYELIIKCRAKSKLNKIWLKYSNHIYYDKDYNPSTISELIRCSSLCIISYSTAIFDTINASLKTINIKKPSPYEDNFFESKHNKNILKLHDILRKDSDSPFINSTNIMNVEIEDFISNYKFIKKKEIGRRGNKNKDYYNGIND